jgi:hypothetical protein
MSCDPASPVSCVGNVVTGPLDLAGKALGSAGSAVGEKVAGSVVQDFADACAKGADWAVHTLLTAWLKSPDPNVTAANSPTVWLQQRLFWLVPVVMLGAVLVGAWRLALTRRGEPAKDLAAALVRTVAVSVAAGTVLTALLAFGDAFTRWILDQSQVDFAPSIALAASSGGFPSMLVILLGLIVILTQIVQYGLMMVRNAMIVLLAGVLPVAAASSNTVAGKQWWTKSVAWLVAFTLYKPVAAIIYAVSFRMTARDQDPTTVVSGVFLMVLAVFALPALLRFLVPATTAMASGNAGAVAGAVVGGTIATGAVVATGGMGAAAYAGRAVPTSMAAMPTGARGGGGSGWGSGGGVPSARTTTTVLQGVNGMRGKGSGTGTGIVGGHDQ